MHFNFHRELDFVYINVCQIARVSKNSPSIFIIYVTTKKNEGRQNVASTINRTFSAGVKDGIIELGFHVKDNGRLFRLSGGNLLSKEKGRNQFYHGIDKVYGVQIKLKINYSF